MQNYVYGLPKRMGISLASLFERDGYGTDRHAWKHRVIQDVQAERDRLPVDADDAQIYQAAQMAVREVYRYAESCKHPALIVDGITLLCRRFGIAAPLGVDNAEQIKRAVDKNWWIRSIRKEHARRFEHVAIQLGFVSYKAGVYISIESAIRQRKRNADNAKLLANTEMVNEFGQKYTLEELAALGVANKAIRRGELMTRIRGFEEIAMECGDVGMFWTITCPSKFHAVLSKSGETNPNYQGASPRQAQAYLCKVWARIRASLKRAGIQPYGFRIAEPHHDGCPHWHMLLFVDKTRINDMEMIVTAYATQEDETEKGAHDNRVKLVNIEAGKGTAAGYIAKYVAKNIDGAHVGEHKTSNGWIVTNDLLGNQEITPSERVTCWSQLHGIRQFQQIGGAPVGVWRELRRIKYDAVLHAPDCIKSAWAAVQKVEDQNASYADFIRACGGATVGRGCAIAIAKKEVEIIGRYATYSAEKPCGVFAVNNPHAVYESVRYRWSRVDGSGGAVAVDLPWTRVNNCTRTSESDEFKEWKKELWNVDKTQNCAPDWMANVMQRAKEWDTSREYDENGRLKQ